MTMTLRTLDVRLIQGASGGLHIPPLHVGITPWACAGKASKVVAEAAPSYVADSTWSSAVVALVEELNFVQAGEELVRQLMPYKQKMICRRCSAVFRRE